MLESCGGWDPYNVTEDADLGLRITRWGGRVIVLNSTTWEEAPRTLRQWLPQRTRWLKGWMITLLVHTRSPRSLARELGPWRTFGLFAITGGMLMSSLVHLAFYGLLIGNLFAGNLLLWPETAVGQVVAILTAFNLAAGYGSAMLLGIVAGSRRHGWAALLWALTMPLYWMLVSAAAIRAGWQLVRAPHLWEKTSHEARRRRA